MKLTIGYSLEKELLRYFDILNNLQHCSFQNLGFYVLPAIPKEFRERVVVFPILLPEFTFSHVDSVQEYVEALPSEIKSNLLQKIDSLYRSKKSKITAFIERLEKNKPEFEKVLTEQGMQGEINLYPTMFGSIGAQKIYETYKEAFPRYDRSIKAVFAMLLGMHLHTQEGARPSYKDTPAEWKQKSVRIREMINELQVTFADEPVVRKVDLAKTLRDQVSGALAVKSAQFLQKIGCNKPIEIKSAEQFCSLTAKEREVLSICIDKRYQLVSTDTIAACLWGANWRKSFSYYAIAKVMQRIREKIRKERNDKYYNCLHSQRGKGYVLYE